MHYRAIQVVSRVITEQRERERERERELNAINRVGEEE